MCSVLAVRLIQAKQTASKSVVIQEAGRVAITVGLLGFPACLCKMHSPEGWLRKAGPFGGHGALRAPPSWAGNALRKGRAFSLAALAFLS